MPSTLSGGFDFEVQFTFAAIQKVLQAVYKSGMIPNYLSKEVDVFGGKHKVDIYFDQPAVYFAYDPSMTNPITFRQSIIVRIEDLYDEFEGNYGFTTELYKKTQTINGAAVDFITLDFTSAAPDQIQLNLPVDPALTGIIKLAISALLFTQIINIPVSPSIPKDGPLNIGYWDFKVFHDPSFHPPEHYWEGYYHHDFMGFFMNTANASTPIPNSVPLFLYYEAQGQSSQPVYNQDYAFSIPADLINKAIGDSIAEMKLPSAVPGHSDVTLNSIGMSLENGNIHFWGSVTKTTSGLPDADADFDGHCGLVISGGKLEVNPLQVDVDLPWWIDLLNFLPFIGQILIGMIHRAVEEATSSISIAIDIPELTFFAGDIAVTTGTPPSTPAIKIKNEGRIAVHPDGLVVYGTFDIFVNEVELHKSRYITGHKATLEFHRDFCVYGKKATNNERFINEA